MHSSSSAATLSGLFLPLNDGRRGKLLAENDAMTAQGQHAHNAEDHKDEAPRLGHRRDGHDDTVHPIRWTARRRDLIVDPVQTSGDIDHAAQGEPSCTGVDLDSATAATSAQQA